jgi:hypothetical protein
MQNSDGGWATYQKTKEAKHVVVIYSLLQQLRAEAGSRLDGADQSGGGVSRHYGGLQLRGVHLGLLAGARLVSARVPLSPRGGGCAGGGAGSGVCARCAEGGRVVAGQVGRVLHVRNVVRSGGTGGGGRAARDKRGLAARQRVALGRAEPQRIVGRRLSELRAG